MAKKETAKTPKVKKDIVETPEVVEAPVVETIDNVEENNEPQVEMPESVQELVTELEVVKPTEDFLETVTSSDEETAKELLNEKLEALSDIKEKIKAEMENVVAANPKLRNNSSFTYVWNGVNMYE